MDDDDKGTGEISRREALRKGMKTGAYVAPVILSASVAGGVSAQGLVSRPTAPTPRTPQPILLQKQFDSLSANGRTINFIIQLDNLVVDPVTGQGKIDPVTGQPVVTSPLYNVLISDAITRSSSGTIGQLTFTDTAAAITGQASNIQDNGNGTFTVKLLLQDVGATPRTQFVQATAQLNTSVNPGETVTNTVTAISASVGVPSPGAPFGVPGASVPFAAPPPTATAVYTRSIGIPIS